MDYNQLEPRLRNFVDAFDSYTGSCVRDCHCGKTYWDSYNSGYSWDDGEVERLEKNPNAIRLDHSVGFVRFEGREYVSDCDCWIERATKLMDFIDSHGEEIARWLTLEKKRKQDIADEAPIVK